MNGVAEALLDEILAQSKEQTAFLKQMASSRSGAGGGSSGGSGTAGATGSAGVALTMFAGTVKMASTAIGALAGIAGGIVSASFTSLAGITKGLASAQMQLAETAISGSGSLSSFYDSLTQLPGILGFAAKVFSYHTQILQKNLETFQAMSDSGATLGGNLDEVRRSAKSMYLSMDEFANLMKNNAPYLLYFGQTANDGARALVKFNSTMIQGSTGRALLGMGYSLEEANNMLGLYAATMGGVNSQQLSDQRKMESSVKSFATEMALSAELEGKSRKQKEDEMKERAAIAARENMLSKMTQEQRDAYNQAELAAGRAGGKAAQDALLSAMLGLPPMTKAAQTWTAMAGESAQSITGMVPAIQNANAENANNQREISRLGAQASKQAVDASKNFGDVLNVMSFRQGEVAETGQALQRAEATARNQNLKTTQDYLDRENKAREQLTEAQKSQAGAVAQAAGEAKYQGEWLMDMLYDILNPLKPVLIGLVNIFTEFAPKVLGFANDLMDQVLVPLFQSLFGDLDMEDIVAPFRDFFKGFFGEDTFGLTEVKDNLEAVLKPLTEAIGEFFKSVDWVAVGAGMRTVFDVLINVGKIVGSVLIGAINLAIGVFNLIVAVGTSLYRIVDYLLEPFGGIADVIEGPMISAFNSISSLLTDTIIPWFNSLGEKLSNFAAWIDSSTQIIQGPLKFALDLLRVSLIGVGIVLGVQKGIILVQNGLMALRSMWETIAIAGLIAWDAVVVAGTALMGALGTAMAFLLSPIGLVIIAVGLVAAGLYYLYSQGESLSTAFGSIKDAVGGWIDAIDGFIDGILNLLPEWAGGISDEEKARRDAARADDAREREARGKARDEERARNKAELDREDRTSAGPAFSIGNITNPFSGGSPASLTAPQQRNAPAGPSTPPLVNQPAANLGAGAAEASAAAANLPPMTAAAMSFRPGAESGGAIPDAATLNTNLQQMIRNLRDISDNTKRTADLIASNGNLFRR